MFSTAEGSTVYIYILYRYVWPIPDSLTLPNGLPCGHPALARACNLLFAHVLCVLTLC